MYGKKESYRNGKDVSTMDVEEGRTTSQLHGKVALILGGESENGRLLITALAQRGANLVLVRADEMQTALAELQATVEKLGRRCLLLTGDVRSKDFAQQAIKQIMQTFGRLDIFIDYSTDEKSNEDEEKSVFNNLALMTAALDQISQT